MLSVVSSKKICEENKEIHIKDIILINANVWGVSLRNVEPSLLLIMINKSWEWEAHSYPLFLKLKILDIFQVITCEITKFMF